MTILNEDYRSFLFAQVINIQVLSYINKKNRYSRGSPFLRIIFVLMYFCRNVSEMWSSFWSMIVICKQEEAIMVLLYADVVIFSLIVYKHSLKFLQT